MKDKITKFKCFFDFDKEIEYINRMNKEGWKLVYIKAGCLFTFVRTHPDEYITILHADKKENLASVAAFAAQCGYENVPHTMDGFGDVMYLTGRKSEVSDDFVTDNESKITVNKIMLKKFRVIVVLFAILTVFAVAVAVDNWYCYYNFHLVYCLRYNFAPSAFYTTFAVIDGLMAIICFVLLGVLFKITHRIKNKVKKLKEELSIYE